MMMTRANKMQPEVRQCWSRVEGSRNGELGWAGSGHQLGWGNEKLRDSGRPWLAGFLLLVPKMGNLGEGVVATMGEVGLWTIVVYFVR